MAGHVANKVSASGDSAIFHLWLDELPAGPEHLPALRKLFKLGDSTAAAATALAVKISGSEIKGELLDLLDTHGDDYNFATNGLAEALKAMVNSDDLSRIFLIAEKWATISPNSGTALGKVLSAFDPQYLVQHAFPKDIAASDGMVRVIASALKESEDERSFEALADLLLAFPDIVCGSFSLALAGRNSDQVRAGISALNHRHIDAVWSARYNCSIWDTGFSSLCKNSETLTQYVDHLIKLHHGIEAIALRMCLGQDEDVIFSELENLLSRPDRELQDEPFEIIDLTDLNWHGREAFLLECLSRDIARLRRSMLRGEFSELRHGCLNCDQIARFIEKMEPEDLSSLRGHRIGRLLARVGDATVIDYLLGFLTKNDGPIKRWVKQFYIQSNSKLTTDSLTDDMIATLLADLSVKGRISEWFSNPLGSIATEQFVQERLLPLATNASPDFCTNLEIVLRSVGNRHGKRYLLPK